jgi:hypothetical protein
MVRMNDARGGPREHRPPMTVEVDHSIVVSLRPEARRRDVPVARLVRDLLDLRSRALSARSSMTASAAHRPAARFVSLRLRRLLASHRLGRSCH